MSDVEEKGTDMAENVKRTFKDLTDGEKYRIIVRKAKKAGIILGGTALGAAVFVIGFRSGKTTGAYQTFEEIYKNCPDAREYLTTLDPVFATTIEI